MRTLATSKMSSTMQQVASSWKGESANEFLVKNELLSSEIQTISENLLAISEDIKQAAKRMYEAEQAAAKIAQDRAY